jgi:hypothetical protein
MIFPAGSLARAIDAGESFGGHTGFLPRQFFVLHRDARKHPAKAKSRKKIDSLI